MARRFGSPNSTHPPRPAVRARRVRTGFTLLETMLALTIVLVGVLAVVQAQQSFLYNNVWSSHAATANYLANEVREMTRAFPRHDRFSGGLYLAVAGDPSSLTGWGPEPGDDLPSDLDDLDDLDGAVFGDAATLPEGFTEVTRFDGPVNAFGDVIPETLWDGATETVEAGGEQVAVSMRGWTQIVTVEKVDPWDYSTVVPNEELEANVRDVDEYPLLVTVRVLYQGEFSESAPSVTEVSWVVPP